MKKTPAALVLAMLVIGAIGSGCKEVAAVVEPERLDGKYAYSFLGAKTTSLRFSKDGTVYVGTFLGTEVKGTYTMNDEKVDVTYNNNGTTVSQTLTYTKSSDSLADPSNKIFEREN